VGPDTFWTLPHILVYSGSAFAGLFSLWAILSTTARYKNGNPDVSDENTTLLFGRFRASAGFYITGFGSLAFLLSGFFDLWWHTVYGFDVTLLSPSHFGLFFSSIACVIGTIYVFAAELNQSKQRMVVTIIGLTLAIALLLAELNPFIIILSSILGIIGPVYVYQVIMAVLLSVGFIVPLAFLKKPGIASLTALFYTIIRTIIQNIAPVAVNWLRIQLGYSFKVDAIHSVVYTMFMPTTVLLAAIILDLGLWAALKRKKRFSMYPIMFAAAIGTFIMYWTERFSLQTKLERIMEKHGMISSLSATSHDFYISCVVGIIAAFILSRLGWSFGVILRYRKN
jgi:hypothetical protein